MLKRPPVGQYVPGSSFLHRLDPRTKIFLSGGYMVSLFVVAGSAGYGLMTAYLLGALILGRLPLGRIAAALKPVMLLLGLTLVVNLVAVPGEVLWRAGPVTVTDAGLSRGAVLTLRLLLLILAGAAVTLVTSPTALTDGLERLMRPLRRIGVPAHELALMMTIALRFIPLLFDEADRTVKAQTARGARFDGALAERIRSMTALLVPLFVSVFRRAEDLATAMEARGYRGGAGRTQYRPLRFHVRDGAAAAVSLAVFALAVGEGWLW